MCHVADGYLAILRGIADVLRVRSDDVREFQLQRVDNIPRFGKAQSGLRQICHAVWIRDLKRLNFSDIRNDLGNLRCFAECPLNFVVVAVANKDQRIALLSEFHGLDVNLRDQRTSCVDDLKTTPFAAIANGRRNSVCRVNHALAIGTSSIS